MYLFYLNDLIALEGVKNFNFMDNINCINIDKIAKTGELISEIWLYKLQPHRFQKVNQIYDFFDRGLFYMEEELIAAKSKELEQVEENFGSQKKSISKTLFGRKKKE